MEEARLPLSGAIIAERIRTDATEAEPMEQTGLLCWVIPSGCARRMGGTREHTEPISVDALAWTTIGTSVRVVLMTRTKRLPAPLHGTDSPLSVVESMAVPARMDFEGMEARQVRPGGVMGQLSPERVRPMLRVASWLSAAWVLMATPTVAEPRPMDGRWGGPVTGQTRPRDRVTVVDMRPMRQVHTTTDATGRRLTTRHVVRGHWTHQPYGPKRSL